MTIDPSRCDAAAANLTGMNARPGWYPDPSGAPGKRYWDGYAWHDAVPARPGPVAPKPPTNWKALGIMGGAVVALIVVASIIGGLTGGGEDEKRGSASATTARTGPGGEFLDWLEKYDFNVTADNAQTLINAGELICVGLRNGGTPEEGIAVLYRTIPDMSEKQAGLFVSAAQFGLCPDTM
jgi:hypothetical protein